MLFVVIDVRKERQSHTWSGTCLYQLSVIGASDSYFTVISFQEGSVCSSCHRVDRMPADDVKYFQRAFVENLLVQVLEA